MKRLLVGLAAVLFLAGCQQPEPQLDIPVDQLVPVDALELHSAYFASDRSRQAFPLLNDRNRGFYFFPDGYVRYVALGAVAGSGLAHDTYVIQPVEGNRVCVAAVSSWSGACMEIFEGAESNTLVVVGEYGNGYRFEFVSQDFLEAPQPS